MAKCEMLAPPNWAGVRSALVADVLLGAAGTDRLVRFRVQGESMLPTLWPGDWVEIQGCSPLDLRPGEIVLAARDHRFFLHRLQTKSMFHGFTLRGDSLPQPDPSYPVEALVGRLTRRVDDRCPNNQSPPAALAFQSGLVAKLYCAAGWVLCRWNFARRVVLKLHTLRKAAPNEVSGLEPSDLQDRAALSASMAAESLPNP
jgi:signal peptidase I